MTLFKRNKKDQKLSYATKKISKYIPRKTLLT
jgi:hypothetical protein